MGKVFNWCGTKQTESDKFYKTRWNIFETRENALAAAKNAGIEEADVWQNGIAYIYNPDQKKEETMEFSKHFKECEHAKMMRVPKIKKELLEIMASYEHIVDPKPEFRQCIICGYFDADFYFTIDDNIADQQKILDEMFAEIDAYLEEEKGLEIENRWVEE